MDPGLCGDGASAQPKGPHFDTTKGVCERFPHPAPSRLPAVGATILTVMSRMAPAFTGMPVILML